MYLIKIRKRFSVMEYDYGKIIYIMMKYIYNDEYIYIFYSKG